MKKLLAISLILTLFLQAIPILHFFCNEDNSSNFYTLIDEDKPDESKSKVKKEGKEYILPEIVSLQVNNKRLHSFCRHISILPSPAIDLLAPPPDHVD